MFEGSLLNIFPVCFSKVFYYWLTLIKIPLLLLHKLRILATFCVNFKWLETFSSQIALNPFYWPFLLAYLTKPAEDQVSKFESSPVRMFAQDFISLALQSQYINELSAYWKPVHLGTQFFISLKHKLNNAGPKIDPCGTRFGQRESICSKWLLFDHVRSIQEDYQLRSEYLFS